MKIKIYQVDAFGEKIFTGNPAAVSPLGNDWLDEKTMQAIANENKEPEEWQDFYRVFKRFTWRNKQQ